MQKLRLVFQILKDLSWITQERHLKTKSHECEKKFPTASDVKKHNRVCTEKSALNVTYALLDSQWIDP